MVIFAKHGNPASELAPNVSLKLMGNGDVKHVRNVEWQML